MWQRIQTLYMGIDVIMLTVALFFVDRTAYVILLALGLAANLLPIFTFRHRMLQLRLLIFAAVVLLGLQAWMAFDYFTASQTAQFNYAWVVPFIAAVLDFLAVRGVISDELIVRSSSRLRAAKKKH